VEYRDFFAAGALPPSVEMFVVGVDKKKQDIPSGCTNKRDKGKSKGGRWLGKFYIPTHSR
jgi:hypothetical protein